MPLDDTEAITELEQLYAQLPTVECQGLCWNSCGPIDMSEVELRRLKAAGFDIPKFTHEAHARWKRNEPLRCPALTAWGRCAAYELRPLICRLWGVGRDTLACPHGCKVTGRRVKTEEAMALMQRSHAIGGDHSGWWAEAAHLLQDPQLKPLLLRLVKGDDSAYRPLVTALRERRR